MKTTLQIAGRALVILACAVLIGGVAYLLVGTGSSAPSMPAGEMHGGHGESASLFGIVSVVQNLVEIGVVVGLVSLLTWLFGRRRRATAQ